MMKINMIRERVIEILGEEGYFSTGEFDEGFECFKNDSHLVHIYLGNSAIEAYCYPIAYDFKYNGCENGLRSYIIGTQDV